MLDVMPVADTLQYFRDFVLVIVWSQQRDRPADHLFSNVAVNMFRALVPVGNDAVQVLAVAQLLVSAAQFLFDSYTVADIANCAEHHDPIVGWNGTQADLDGKLRSVLTPSPEIEARTHTACLGLFGKVVAMVTMLLAE